MSFRWIILVAVFAGLLIFAARNPGSLKDTAGVIRLAVASLAGGVFLHFVLGRVTLGEFHVLSLIYDFLLSIILVSVTGGPFPQAGSAGPQANLLLFLFPLLLINGTASLGLLLGMGGAALSGVILAFMAMSQSGGQVPWELFVLLVICNFAMVAASASAAGAMKVPVLQEGGEGEESGAAGGHDGSWLGEKLATARDAKEEEPQADPQEEDVFKRKDSYTPQEEEEFLDPLHRYRMMIAKEGARCENKPGPEEAAADAAADAAAEEIARLKRDKEEAENALQDIQKDAEAREKREQELVEKVRYFSSLIELSAKMGKAFQLSDLLDTILDNICKGLNSPIGFVMLLKDEKLTVASSAGLSQEGKEMLATTISPEGGVLARTVHTSHPLRISRGDNEKDFASFDGMPEKLGSLMLAPIINPRDGLTLGLIGVAGGEGSRPYTGEQENFLHIFAAQSASFIRQFKLTSDLESTYGELMTALAQAIESRDVLTKGHVRRVADLSVRLAGVLKLSPEEQKRIEQASILHDIGKITVPKELLNKPSGLTGEEYSFIKKHSAEGYKLLSRPELNIDEGIKQFVLYHHERWDGKGYPKGLAGDAIPLGAQIIGIANTYDAMVSDRPYRKGMASGEALKRMIAESGTKYNPRVIQAFSDMLQNDEKALPAPAREPATEVAGIDAKRGVPMEIKRGKLSRSLESELDSQGG
jgi:HD-GYP domain-containing protein (c-di-GMP phosphodiesterase class II)